MDLAEIRKRCAAGEAFDYLFFWGHQVPADGSVSASCLSQWYPAPFTIDKTSYATAEHWMMAEKARLFADQDALQQILEADHPKMAKALGRTVKNFDEAIWKANCRRLVTEGNVEKFRQNPAMLKFLTATGNKVIVEAAPRDCIWGIGMGRDNPKALSPATWRGQNLLGFALMDVRAQLSG